MARVLGECRRGAVRKLTSRGSPMSASMLWNGVSWSGEERRGEERRGEARRVADIDTISFLLEPRQGLKISLARNFFNAGSRARRRFLVIFSAKAATRGRRQEKGKRKMKKKGEKKNATALSRAPTRNCRT
jgi:hypothetical protein